MIQAIFWFAAATGITAAFMIAGNFGARITGYGFVVFTVSSVAWVTAGLIEGTGSLVAQNAVLFGINLLGIYRWLYLKQKLPR